MVPFLISKVLVNYYWINVLLLPKLIKDSLNVSVKTDMPIDILLRNAVQISWRCVSYISCIKPVIVL